MVSLRHLVRFFGVGLRLGLALAFGLALAAALRGVLERSIETGGSSIRDYVTPDGSDGGFQEERRVYARKGEPCATCGTEIRRIVVGQRGTHLCTRCQRPAAVRG